MREVWAAIAALAVTAIILFLGAFAVCALAMATKSIGVAIVGAAVVIPFGFYAGYWVAKKMLADRGR